MSAVAVSDFIYVVTKLSATIVSKNGKSIPPKLRAHVRNGYKKTVHNYSLFKLESQTRILVASEGSAIGLVQGEFLMGGKRTIQLVIKDQGSFATVTQAEEHLYEMFEKLVKNQSRTFGKFNTKNWNGFYILTKKPGKKAKALMKAVAQGVISKNFEQIMRDWDFTMSEH